MAGVPLSFRASVHEYLEKFTTSAATTPTTSGQDVSPSQNSVQSYGFLRDIAIRLRNSSGGTGGNLNAWPIAAKIFDACMQLDAFASEQPMKQPDAPANPGH